jgi:hypothetical protein
MHRMPRPHARAGHPHVCFRPATSGVGCGVGAFPALEEFGTWRSAKSRIARMGSSRLIGSDGSPTTVRAIAESVAGRAGAVAESAGASRRLIRPGGRIGPTAFSTTGLFCAAEKRGKFTPRIVGWRC